MFVLKILFILIVADIMCQALFGNSITKQIQQLGNNRKNKQLETKLAQLELEESKLDNQ